MMRILTFIILLLTTTMTFSETTIHTVIKAGTFLSASWWEKSMGLNNDFPQKQYESHAVPFANPYYVGLDHSPNINVRNSELVLLTLKLKLISYDPTTNSYKFKLSASKIGLQKDIKYKRMSVDVYFDNIKSKELNLNGTFLILAKGIPLPKLDHTSENDIVLSINQLNDITMGFQHNVPITINLHD